MDGRPRRGRERGPCSEDHHLLRGPPSPHVGEGLDMRMIRGAYAPANAMLFSFESSSVQRCSFDAPQGPN